MDKFDSCLFVVVSNIIWRRFKDYEIWIFKKKNSSKEDIDELSCRDLNYENKTLASASWLTASDVIF